MRFFLATALFAILGVTACGAPYHHYRQPPHGYYHDHRLTCGHYVSCRVRLGAHHFRPHHGHREYYHRHRVRRYHVPCHVIHGRHVY